MGVPLNSYGGNPEKRSYKKFTTILACCIAELAVMWLSYIVADFSSGSGHFIISENRIAAPLISMQSWRGSLGRSSEPSRTSRHVVRQIKKPVVVAARVRWRQAIARLRLSRSYLGMKFWW